MSTPALLVVDQRGVATLMLNHPEKRNALSAAMVAALDSYLTELEHNKTVRLLVITGAGKHFCAGAELAQEAELAQASETDNFTHAMQLARCLQKLAEFSKPVIARINGDALGDALGLVACADLALSAPDAAFGCPDIRHGLAPLASLPYLASALGTRTARQWLLGGEHLDAHAAKACGLITHIADEQQLDALVNRHIALLLEARAPAQLAIKESLKEFDPATAQNDLVTARLARRMARLRMHADTRQALTTHRDAGDGDNTARN